LLLLCILFSFASCGTSEAAADLKEKETRVIVDCVGREVEVPQRVDRIACLYAFSGHVTALLGQADKIVAVVNGLQRDLLLTEMYPSILDAAVPYTEGSINIEELVKTEPDVVFIRESTYETTEEMKKLEAFDLPVVVIDSNTIEQQRKAVAVVGEICGGDALKKAGEYEAFFQEAVDFAGSKKELIEKGRKVRVYHSINEATRTDMQNTLPAQWIELVGVENVSVGQELGALEGKTYANLEQIYLWDPELIICNEPGVANYMLEDSKWAELQAVKEKKVYQMPIGISRWGHPGSVETPLAIYWLGKLAYPEEYKDLDLDAKTREFYGTFFKRELTGEDLGKIFSGEGMRKDQ